MSIPMHGVTGNLTGDPELRFTPKGDPAANFRVAINERFRQGNEWVDGKPEFLSCSIFGKAAENVAESLSKGCAVIMNGRLSTEEYTTRDGEPRKELVLRVSKIGVDLARATAKVTRTQGADREQGGWGDAR